MARSSQNIGKNIGKKRPSWRQLLQQDGILEASRGQVGSKMAQCSRNIWKTIGIRGPMEGPTKAKISLKYKSSKDSVNYSISGHRFGSKKARCGQNLKKKNIGNKRPTGTWRSEGRRQVGSKMAQGSENIWQIIGKRSPDGIEVGSKMARCSQNLWKTIGKERPRGKCLLEAWRNARSHLICSAD